MTEHTKQHSYRSERVSFQDAKNDIVAFRVSARAALQNLKGILPSKERFRIQWVSKLNSDHASEDFNPLGSWGRWVAIEDDAAPEDQDPMENMLKAAASYLGK